jgi:uncharacterized protein YxeA
MEDKVLEIFVPYIQLCCGKITYHIEFESSNVISMCTNKPDSSEYIFDKRKNAYKNFKEMDDKVSQLLRKYIIDLFEIGVDKTSIDFWIDSDLPENKHVNLSHCDILIIKDNYDLHGGCKYE